MAGITYQNTIEEDPMAPICYLEIDENVIGMSGRDLVKLLRDGDPSIEVIYEPIFLLDDYVGKVTINPQYMLEGDDEIVINQIKKLLSEN